MADWTTIADTAVDPDAPVTSELGYAWRDNPIAIAEGALGAPRVEGRALLTHMGVLTYSANTPSGFTDLDRFELLRADFWLKWGAGTTNLQIRYSNNNGANYGSYQNTIFGVSEEVVVGSFRVNLRTGSWFCIAARNGPPLYGAGTHTVPSGCNAFQLRNSIAGGSGNFDFYCLGGLTA